MKVEVRPDLLRYVTTSLVGVEVVVVLVVGQVIELVESFDPPNVIMGVRYDKNLKLLLLGQIPRR